jgi:O-methyltransferase involved in polyketide biosynthesis
VSDARRIPADLSGVPETLLWTLHYRAQEAARPDAVLRDPLAVEIARRIDYPFQQRVGSGPRRAQWQGLRARTFDREIEAFLRARPGATVVALGEGLETQFWRVDDGRVRWLGVDLPDSTPLRRAALPPHERRRMLEASVLHDDWFAEVDPSRGVLFTAQGLLMYLQPHDVHRLITRLAARFPGSSLLFDGVPRWTSAAVTRRPARSETSAPIPPMPWPVDSKEAAEVRRLPGVERVRRLHPPRGRGPLFGWLHPVVDRTPVLSDLVLAVWRVDFTAP